jgi:hypothetical protein
VYLAFALGHKLPFVRYLDKLLYQIHLNYLPDQQESYLYKYKAKLTQWKKTEKGVTMPTDK